MGRGWSKMARGACRTLDIVRTIEGHCRRIFGRVDKSVEDELALAGMSKRKRTRRGGRRRQKQQLVLHHETRQRPVWWPKKAVVARPTMPKRREEIFRAKTMQCGTAAGVAHWALKLEADDRYGDLFFEDSAFATFVGMRKAAVVASESCRFGRYGDDTQTYQGRNHEQVVERRHQVSGPSFKKFEQLVPPAVDFYDEHGAIID